MIPKTEKELELYFKLMELFELRKEANKKYYINPSHEFLETQYEKMKKEYLKSANEER